MDKEYFKKLTNLMTEYMDLNVVCKNDSSFSELDASDECLGRLDTTIEPYIDLYSTNIGDTTKFKSDANYLAWIEEAFDTDSFVEVSDEDWEQFCIQKVDEIADWKQAIVISVKPLE